MKKSEKITKGYKVTDGNMKCRNYQFELGNRHKETGTIEVCQHGFHFCELTNSCFEYYSFDPKNRVFEVIAYGDIKTENDKSCCLEIELVRELTWLEVLTQCNSGKDNTGRSNSGNSNSGYRNSGYRNSGDSNSGYRNSGYRNSGNWNSGDSNSGDSNSGYRNSGAFCTDNDPKVFLFDKEVKGMTVRQWERHEAYSIMANYLNPNIWVETSSMTDGEKTKFPSHETTGGYLKRIPMHEAWSNMWHNLTDAKRKVFIKLPNFDKKKFKEITGIDV